MSDSSQELDAIIAQYFYARETGDAISIDKLIVKHPDLAKRLGEFFDDLVRMGKFTDEPTESIEIPENHFSNSRSQSRLIAGRYKLLQKIGAGGMGEVWMADQLEPVRRRVALKRIKAGNPCQLTRRF